MEIFQLNEQTYDEALQKAVAVLRAGGLIIYPTETCYGIGADATNQEAIDKLHAYKTKRADKPISIAVTDTQMAEQYVDVNDAARNMYEHHLPGPITVVSKGLGRVARGVESNMGTQGIRIPDYPFVLDMVRELGRPITATSANASYKKTPYCVEDVLENTSSKQQELVDLFIDAGTLPPKKPSTVVDTTLDNIFIMRGGGIEIEGDRAFLSYSLDDTEKFAGQIASELREVLGSRAVVLLLQGDLGAGKTHFTQFFAKELGVTDVVNSPTFNIYKEYSLPTDGQLVHMDTYRLFQAEDIDELRPEDIFASPNVVVIEWANKVADHIQPWLKDAAVVKMNFTVVNDTTRRIEYSIEQ